MKECITSYYKEGSNLLWNDNGLFFSTNLMVFPYTTTVTKQFCSMQNSTSDIKQLTGNVVSTKRLLYFCIILYSWGNHVIFCLPVDLLSQAESSSMQWDEAPLNMANWSNGCRVMTDENGRATFLGGLAAEIFFEWCNVCNDFVRNFMVS